MKRGLALSELAQLRRLDVALTLTFERGLDLKRGLALIGELTLRGLTLRAMDLKRGLTQRAGCDERVGCERAGSEQRAGPNGRT